MGCGEENMPGLRTTISAGAAFLVLFGAVLGLLHWEPFAHAVQGSVDLVAIDMNTTGNDDTNVGTIQNCAAIPNVGVHNQSPPAAGTTQIFDLAVKGIDPADKIKAYQFDIDYNAAVIEIIGVKAVDGTPTDSQLGGIPDGTVSILSRIDSFSGAGFINRRTIRNTALETMTKSITVPANAP